jgi:radical SAM superfamily enzyme YgiQ (UPF0313 family)
MPRVLLVYPEFRSASFWNYRDACALMDAKYPAAPLGLITVAAMLPTAWEVRLVDRNVEPLEDGDLAWADYVFTGGMLPQQRDCLELIDRARGLGKTVVVGGPDVTSSPEIYGTADHLILGEAEVTLPAFLRDLDRGTAQPVYQDPAKASMLDSPTPRFDLLKFDRYNHIGIQWCRGCPFNCEFCDIIELFGRVPRAKTPEQILAELQRLFDLGYRGHVDLVDDNFIGNKKLAKQFLPVLKEWLTARDWPFEFTTEASINLADDDELMRMMKEVGFFAIFVGIESPDEETLYAMQKRQNTRRSIVESVEKFYRAGFFVNAGFIIGFDTERGSVSRGITACIEETAIPAAMVGLLYALPNTQLTRRLATEGRLHRDSALQPAGAGDQCTTGINFDPCRSRADILRDYLAVVESVYAPREYFARVARVGRMLDSSERRYRPSVGRWAREARGFIRMAGQLGLTGSSRWPFWRAFLGTLLRNPSSIRYVGAMCGLFVHFGPFSEEVGRRIRLAILEEERAPSAMAAAPAPRVRAATAARAAAAPQVQ